MNILHYDEYHDNDDLFFLNDEKYILLTVKKYIRDYFSKDI